MQRRKNFTLEDAKVFNELHNEKFITLRKIAVLFGTSHGTISSNLKKHGFKVRSRQYPVNEEFFNKLDSFEKHYLLGWIYSDGCLFAYEEKMYYGITIKIQERDQYILEYFKELLCSDSNITTDIIDQRKYTRLKIGSKKIHDDLLKYGLIPRKTHFITYPEQHLMDHRAFILGLFEGDGTIHIKKNKMPAFGITGTKNMMMKVSNIIAKELNLKPAKLVRCRNSYSFYYSGTRSVQKIGEWLYSWNPQIFLKRKRDLFDKAINMKKYGKQFIVFKCPQCGTIKEFEKRLIYLLKRYTFKSKFCSLSCSGSFSRKYQLNGYKLTPEMELRLKENIIDTITRYKVTDPCGGFKEYD